MVPVGKRENWKLEQGALVSTAAILFTAGLFLAKHESSHKHTTVWFVAGVAAGAIGITIAVVMLGRGGIGLASEKRVALAYRRENGKLRSAALAVAAEEDQARAEREKEPWEFAHHLRAEIGAVFLVLRNPKAQSLPAGWKCEVLGPEPAQWVANDPHGGTEEIPEIRLKYPTDFPDAPQGPVAPGLYSVRWS